MFMTSLLNKGYATKVPKSELDKDGDNCKVWYLPHHGVYHPRKPNKIRVVFDCSALYEGVSLNQQLLQGPDLMNNLIGILLRFREHSIAIVGDIEAMFHQVKVQRSDQDYLRFFWWPDGRFTEPPEVYRMTVHLFGAVSSPTCCMLALQLTAK